MRKFFSVLLCFILIISICICSSVSGSSLFIADDLLYSIGLSIAASVLLSIGIAAVSGSDSQYVEFVEACAQITWEQMVQDYTQAEILAMITIENGKAYFRCPEALYHRLVNWASTYDWANLTYMGSISSVSSSLIPNTTIYSLPNYEGNYVINTSGSPLELTVFNSTASYTSQNGCIIQLHGDGNSIICHPDLTTFNNTDFIAMIGITSSGYFRIGNVYTNNSTNPTSISNAKSLQYPSSFSVITEGTSSQPNSYAYINGEVCETKISNSKVYINNTVIADLSGTTSNKYRSSCLIAGRLLSNVQNDIIPINSNSSLDSYQSEVETERLSPAIPGNRIGSEQSVLVPVPSNIVDPAAPDLPLTQSTVKKRVKRGQAVALVPDLPSLQDKTPQDLGVLVVNNTEIEDTVISPTLSTTYIGDNSTTFVIIPDNPGSTPIPNDDNQPLVSSPYPDVINPGNETISISANADVFPTADNPPATTARPSVSVSNPDEVASSAAEDVVEGVSEIASQAVKDIAEPLTPSDIEKGANRMKLMPQLLHKFPFCIPFDFYNAINQFSAPLEVPQFDIPIRIQSLNFNYNVHVDLTNFETAAKISRWFFSVAWVITLIFLTRKVIWK